MAAGVMMHRCLVHVLPLQVSYLGNSAREVELMLLRLKANWGYLPPTIFLTSMRVHPDDIANSKFPGCEVDCECVRDIKRCGMQHCSERYRCALGSCCQCCCFGWS